MVASDDMEPEYLTQMASPTIEEIAEAHPDVVEDIQGFDPVLTAAAFGCLLTIPELQANCFRIQALVHLALAFGEGTGAPTKELIAEQFERLGHGVCGWMEDPAEDVFASRVGTSQGNSGILRGPAQSNRLCLRARKRVCLNWQGPS